MNQPHARFDQPPREEARLPPGVAAVPVVIIGLILEKLVFQKIENYTVVRWGMVTS